MESSVVLKNFETHVVIPAINRKDVDKPLTNFWLAYFLLSWMTLGIYPIILFFKSLGRINKFIERRRHYYEQIIAYSESKASQLNMTNEMADEIGKLKIMTNEEYIKIKPISPVASLIFSVLTAGFYYFFLLYRLNKVWNDLQNHEQQFLDTLNPLWLKMNLIKMPIPFQIDPTKKRSYGINLLLCVVTCGFWGIVWNYKLHTDPDNLYSKFHYAEDMVIDVIKKGEFI